MKRLWMALAGAALFCAGCPVMEMAGTPEWEVYGKIKADFALNTNGAALPASGDYVFYVDDTSPEPDGTFSMTARDSRIGARLDMGAVKGRVEIDFHGDDATADGGDLNFRHAYVTLDLGNDMTLLAGQTSDVFAPLCPSTLNYYVGWRGGNVGHRSPQFRFEWAPEMGPVSVQAALSDPQTELIGFPDIQARAGIKLTDAVKLGASIVMGKTDIDPPGPGGPDGTEEEIFGLAIDVNAKISDKLSIKGEWYTGKNLEDYMGNIGVAIPNNDEVGGDGLWVAVVIEPTEAFTVNAGIMLDSNDEGDIANGVRAETSCIFGNVIWKLNDNTDCGIEISKWETEYKADATAYDNLRIQGSIIVKF